MGSPACYDGTVKLKDEGKEHESGNARCQACAQRAPGGSPLIPAISHFPYVHTSGNPPCGGFVHAEVFGSEREGWEVLYRCDKCGAPQ